MSWKPSRCKPKPPPPLTACPTRWRPLPPSARTNGIPTLIQTRSSPKPPRPMKAISSSRKFPIRNYDVPDANFHVAHGTWYLELDTWYMPMELCDLPALILAENIRLRRVKAIDALEATLARIAAVDGDPPSLEPADPESDNHVHAFITVTAERARLQAREIDSRPGAGGDGGPPAGGGVSE